jgi:hypothetical protein
MLVKSLLEGLGGKVADDEEITDAMLNQLAKQAGLAIPIIRGPDPKEAKTAVILDFEELRLRNDEKRKGLRLA